MLKNLALINAIMCFIIILLASANPIGFTASGGFVGISAFCGWMVAWGNMDA